jgi:hypothetical protein
MKKITVLQLIFALWPMLFLASCIKDLDRFPENDTTAEVVYSTFDGYKSAIAKVYAGYTLTGNAGGIDYGKPDISGLDEGSNGDFLRCFFNHQEMPTDETHCIWNDPGVPELNNINFIATGAFTIGLYDKSILQIMYANEFLKNSTDAASKGFTAEQVSEINAFCAEARFLRAFQYWVLMDVFGNPPFVTETSTFGDLPPQITRAELFNYVESELLDLVNNNLLKEPKANEYGRADKAAAWALLARLYLNADVYTGAAKYTEAITYSQKVIDAGYTLKGTYAHLFLADNDKNNPEVILSINYDGKRTRLDGGTSFLINCGSNGDYQTTYASTLIHYGLTDNNSWSGYRARVEFTDKFDKTNDQRFLFVGENNAIADHPGEYTYGLATYKYRCITSASTPGNPVFGSDIRYADNDFPLFRLAEMYLIYAEAVKRGGSGGSEANALTYINNLRTRAYGNESGNINAGQLTLDFILDERARELYWEAHRRTDLIRYNRFTTGDYIWEWKGGVQQGRAVSGHFNLYPLPSPDLQANPGLKQNPNY